MNRIDITKEAKKNLKIKTREFASLLNSQGRIVLKFLNLLEEDSIMADVAVLKSADILRVPRTGPSTVSTFKKALKKLGLGFADCTTRGLLDAANKVRINSLK